MTTETQDISEEFARHLSGGHTLDTTETFTPLLAFRDKVWSIISERLNLVEDDHCSDIHEMADLQGNKVGRMRNFTGPECHVDWVIHSNIGKPEDTFTNIHLTIWMNGTTDIPHLGMAFGTLPEAFFYADMMPRYELVTHPEYCKKYYTPINQLHLEFGKKLRSEGYTNLIPEMPFIRASLSPCAIASLTTGDFFQEHGEPAILQMVEYWLGLVENAEEITDPAEQARLTERDYAQRRSIVYNDPANPIAERLFGKEATDRLLRILAGEERGA